MLSSKADAQWHEYKGHIHFHTLYSDGSASYADVVRAAALAGLDFIVPTDHNILVAESGGWRDGVLVLLGQEVNDVSLKPEANHLLVTGITSDVTSHAQDPQALVDRVASRGGLSFLAHPRERGSRHFPRIYPWINMQVDGYTGIELWNYMSELKSHISSKAVGLVLSLWPQLFTQGPWPEVLELWDDLSAERPVVAVGGSDNHGGRYQIGPLTRYVFPYDFVFRTINTHILTQSPFTGADSDDQQIVCDALRQGHCWVGYDLLGPSRGFRLWASHDAGLACMGDSIAVSENLQLFIHLPRRARIRLLRDGQVIMQRHDRQLEHRPSAPGVYRVEVHRWYAGRWRGWIYSNPVYVSSDSPHRL